MIANIMYEDMLIMLVSVILFILLIGLIIDFMMMRKVGKRILKCTRCGACMDRWGKYIDDTRPDPSMDVHISKKI